MKLLQLQKSLVDLILQDNLNFSANQASVGFNFKQQQFSIYHNAYRSRLSEVLTADYPKLNVLMGDVQFTAMCAKYIAKYPSHRTSVRYFGEYLSDFLTNEHPYCAVNVFAELASFEWKLSDTIDARNAAVVEIAELHNVALEDWGRLIFTMHPSLRTAIYNYNAPQLWTAIANNEKIQDILHPAINKTAWIMWRCGIQSFFNSCLPYQMFIINSIMNGSNFAVICEGLCDYLEEQNVAQQAAEYLYYLIKSGLIATLSVET